ncbi:opioid growth factor receptor isoform X2 [Dromaius novaehollandiae]|uniref:opioid growth factor receptor isoform X2 n=1 Tax=Dromaius novaehollandiae TaxID=8790 RepID=UPI00311DD2DB
MAVWLGPAAAAGEARDEAALWRYDSTWEDDDEDEEQQQEEEEEEEGGGEAAARAEPQDAAPSGWRSCRQAGGAQFLGRRNWNAAKDLQRYRHHYPGLVEPENDEEEEMWNLSFYKNEICFLPHGLHIETLLESWWDNYEVLEENHSYIQWLFPLREHGMNWHAKPLTRQEIEAFKKSSEVMQRFERAYQLMLRFYGITLTNQKTGELERTENWSERFQNLNRFSHNNLRITRILKCLGEMGYEHYQVHLVKFFLTETLVKETLPNVKRSALDYFLFTIRSKRKRRELVHYAWQHFKPQSSFVWAPQDKLLKYRPCSVKTQLYQKDESKEEPPGKRSDDSVEKDQKDQLLKEEQKVGDNADLQPEEVNEEDTRQKLSECVSEGGDGEGEKDASFAQQEEKDLNSDAEVQSTAENDCTKESKKRKLDASRADTKHSEPLKSPTDIEKISRNLGECAIDAEIPSSVPVLQTEENQETLKEDTVSTEDTAAPEAADAAVKRRKVDKRTLKGKTCTLAINLNMRPPARLNTPVANTETEEGKVSEKKTAVEETSENAGGDAKGGTADSTAECKVPKTDRIYPVSNDLESGGDQVTAKSDQHHCNSMLLGCKSEADKLEQREKAEENANEKVEAKITDKNQDQESLEQSMASVCPEQDSAEAAIQKADSCQHVAEPDEEQAATE